MRVDHIAELTHRPGRLRCLLPWASFRDENRSERATLRQYPVTAKSEGVVYRASLSGLFLRRCVGVELERSATSGFGIVDYLLLNVASSDRAIGILCILDEGIVLLILRRLLGVLKHVDRVRMSTTRVSMLPKMGGCYRVTSMKLGTGVEGS